MKVYMLSEDDFGALIAALQRDPKHDRPGQLSDVERRAHDAAERFFNYAVRAWIEKVKK